MKTSGIRVINITDEQLGMIYSDASNNFLNCKTNQYFIVKTKDDEEIGPFIWTGKEIEEVKYRVFNSNLFGEIKPRNKDKYQMAYMDSLVRNQLTFATGPAGTGKSLLALAYAFQGLEKGIYGNIVIFTNPFVARGAAKLGFLPGDKLEKLLETSIGSILISKIGDRITVEEMIYRGKIILMPIGDCRGYEVPSNSFVYFTEAQNTDIDLMKLFLQRTNDDCKIVVEGDHKAQVDLEQFEGRNNGFRRALEVFSGEDYVGSVNLKNNFRGRISRKAGEM